MLSILEEEDEEDDFADFFVAVSPERKSEIGFVEKDDLEPEEPASIAMPLDIGVQAVIEKDDGCLEHAVENQVCLSLIEIIVIEKDGLCARLISQCYTTSPTKWRPSAPRR